LSLAYLILLSIFSALATIVAQVLEMSEIQTMLTLAGGFILSTMLAALIMVKSAYTLKEYGIRLPLNFKEVWALIPLLAVSALPFIVLGPDTGITPIYILVAMLFTVATVINEEVYFRGLILKTLRTKGTKFAIIISSVIFGISHFGSLAIGKSIEHSLLLVGFAALFGFVCAEIVVKTGSILVPLIWHFTHNIVSIITADASSGTTIAIVGVQCVILVFYAIYLWREIPGEKALDSSNSSTVS